MTPNKMGAAMFGGALAAAVLLVLYFGVLAILSGWDFTLSQFNEYWPYIVLLATGFGIQVGLFLRLRQLTVNHHHANQVVAASGTTSTVAMLACCTHYLVNILPVLGAVGVVSLIAQYQVQLFWIGLAFNSAGVVFVAWQFQTAKRAFREMEAC